MSFGQRALNFYDNANAEFREEIGDDNTKKKLFCICSYKFAGNDPQFNGNFTQYHINYCNDIFQNSTSPWWLEDTNNRDIINFLNNIFIPIINIIYNKINNINKINNEQLINNYSVPISYLQNTCDTLESYCNKCTICLEPICNSTCNNKCLTTCERTFLEVTKLNTRTYNIIYYENGKNKKYEGEFKNNKFDGQGIYYYEDGIKKYEGQFKENKFHGNGIEYYRNKFKYFEGIFNNNIRTMNGILYNINGKIKYNTLIKKSEEQSKDSEMIGSSLGEDSEMVGSSLGEDSVMVGSSLGEDSVMVGSSLGEDSVMVDDESEYQEDKIVTGVECPKSSSEQIYIHLPCGHFFHTECIKNWLSRSNKCPMCKCDLQ
jgi:hypothetical protein